MPSELAEVPFAEWLVPHDGTWKPHADHDTVRFGATRVRDVVASGARFLDCVFTGTVMEGGVLRRARFIDVWAHETHLTATDLTESEWQDSALLGSVLAAVPMPGAHLDRVTFVAASWRE